MAVAGASSSVEAFRGESAGGVLGKNGIEFIRTLPLT